ERPACALGSVGQGRIILGRGQFALQRFPHTLPRGLELIAGDPRAVHVRRYTPQDLLEDLLEVVLVFDQEVQRVQRQICEHGRKRRFRVRRASQPCSTVDKGREDVLQKLVVVAHQQQKLLTAAHDRLLLFGGQLVRAQLLERRQLHDRLVDS